LEKLLGTTYSAVLVGKPEGDLLEDIGVERRAILKCVLKKREWESVDWIHLGREGLLYTR
jgi:hypothetical protein